MDPVWLKRLGALALGIVLALVVIFFIFPPKVQVPAETPDLALPEPVVVLEKKPVTQVLDLSKPGQADALFVFNRETDQPVWEVRNPDPMDHKIEVHKYSINPDSRPVVFQFSVPAGETKSIDLSSLLSQGAQFDFVCIDCAENPLAGKLAFLGNVFEWGRLSFSKSQVSGTLPAFTVNPDKSGMLFVSNVSEEPLQFAVAREGYAPKSFFSLAPHYTLPVALGALDSARVHLLHCPDCSFEPVQVAVIVARTN